MNILFIAFAGIAAGLIVLMALGTLRPPARTGDVRDAPSVDRVSELVENMGYAIDAVSGEPPEIVDIEAHRDAQALEETLLVRWLPPSAGSPGPQTIEMFVKDVQAAGKNRGFLFSSDLLTEEARLCTEGTPVRAFDPPAVQVLRDQYEVSA